MSIAKRIASAASPQLVWANILMICCILLLALSLLALLVGLRRHFTPLLLVCMIFSLAGAVAAALVAHHFYQTYTYWVGYLPEFVDESHPAPTFTHVANQFYDDNQEATILGWAGVVTAVLVTLGALGTWQLVTPEGRDFSDSAPSESPDSSI
jgi:CHASE2 domain-containing sensor protein